MTIRHAVATWGVLAGVALAARADDPAPPPAPSAADAVFGAAAAAARGATVANVVPSTFRTQLVVDNRFPPKVKGAKGEPVKDDDRDPRDRTGKIHCLVCEYGLSPVVAVFVRADLKGARGDAGLGKLIKGTDALIPKYRSDKLAAFVAYLKTEGGPKLVAVKAADGTDQKVVAAKEYPDDEKREAAVKDLRDFAAAVAADNVPFGLSATTSPSILAFGIDDTAPVTVVIYNRLRMVRRWELKLDDLTDEKVAEILAATEEMTAGKQK
jgi:hypothetical protein